MRLGQVRAFVHFAVIALAATAGGAVPETVPKREADEGASIAKELARIEAIGNNRSAIAYIECVLPRVSDNRLRWTLELSRQLHLELNHQHEEALANVRRLLADVQRTSEQYDILADHEAFNLFNLNRADEGIECYDRRIRQATDHPAERLRLLEAKARTLLSHIEPALGIPACREFRLATEPNSRLWRAATEMLALELARNGEHREAIALREELFHGDSDGIASLRIEIAASQLAMGNGDQANRSLDEAENALLKIRRGQNEPDDDELRTRIASLRRVIQRGR